MRKSLLDFCLETGRDELLSQWDEHLNGPLTAADITYGSKRKVWWRCAKGHEWQASAGSRTIKDTGCPVCAGKRVCPGENDLASLFPKFASQWHREKNGALRPEQVTPNSNRRVWWRCSLGHEWQAVVAARTSNGSGCPYCAGRKVLTGFNDLATRKPLLAKQWHPELNGELTPEMFTTGSHRKVWWQCHDGHVWKAVIYSRTGPKRSGCPVCAGRDKSVSLYRTLASEQKPLEEAIGDENNENPVEAHVDPAASAHAVGRHSFTVGLGSGWT